MTMRFLVTVGTGVSRSGVALAQVANNLDLEVRRSLFHAVPWEYRIELRSDTVVSSTSVANRGKSPPLTAHSVTPLLELSTPIHHAHPSR